MAELSVAFSSPSLRLRRALLAIHPRPSGRGILAKESKPSTTDLPACVNTQTGALAGRHVRGVLSFDLEALDRRPELPSGLSLRVEDRSRD